jgi:hypothetical protein
MAAGPVTEFAVARRRLSEVFREEVTQRAGQRQPPGALAAFASSTPSSSRKEAQR